MAESDSPKGDSPAAATDSETPQFAIQRSYVKDLSLETPMGVKVFTQAFQPSVSLDISTRANTVADNMYEVVLTVTVTAKVEEETAYLVELQQAGLFAISGFPEERLPHVLGAVCPNFLFPYARELADSTVVRGGFPPLSLAPIDFDALFRSKQQPAAEQGASIN